MFHKYRNLDTPVVTRSSTFLLTTCRKFCSWFIRILARVSLLEEFRYGIFFLYLEFHNSFIFIALIRCFSCLFVYLFLRQLSLSLAFSF